MERKTEVLKYGWKFRLYPDGAAPAETVLPSFDDSDWEQVRVPHDWAIKGEFRSTNDCTFSKVSQDGINYPIEHTGRTGALPIVGQGVYRLSVDVPDDMESLTLEFDGVMWESHIYVNGQHAFFNHFGYKSFEVDIAPYVNPGEKALIAVTASVYHDCSRWYPGAGIYRHVRLVSKSAAHIVYSGIWLRQLEVRPDLAAFELSMEHTASDSAVLHAEIFSPSGEDVCVADHGTYRGALSTVLCIPSPVLWSTDEPNLYTAHIELRSADGQVLDAEDVRFGIRTLEFTADHGFFLNGKHMKLNGVCNHHDLGSIGAAVSVPALHRQLRLMKEMGVNAIRTSHNPPSPELLNLCDEMGFCVMDELFDEWRLPKISNGYAKYFDEHAEADTVETIRRDRNHPSVILWSIGNEINEQWDPEGWRDAKFLTETCHRTDPTRLVTAGISYPDGAFENHMTDYIDVVGLNYKPLLYEEFHRAHPTVRFVGSETDSCVSTRGVYHLPAAVGIPVNTHDDLTISAYDLDATAWGNYPEREWAAQDDCEFLAGEFVWTGMDYLGEPTPYRAEWPARSAYFGIVDITGQPKNRFYGYKAHWTDAEVLHVFPHWNWKGMEGQIVPVHAYTSWPSAELFINGKSFGVRRLAETGEIERYRLIWNNAVYEPGEIKVVAYDEHGAPAAEESIRTAGKSHHVVLTAERDVITADGDDLVYVKAAIVDENGALCPLASDRLFFSVDGAGELLTTDSGDQRETESFARPDKKALAGTSVACIRSVIGHPGDIRISVSADRLAGDSITVKSAE